MSYTRVNWKDAPDTTTPVNASNLNAMDKGIKDIDDSLVISKKTLSAGSTSITFTDSRIDEDTIFSFYTSVYGVSPTEVSVLTGSVTLTFDAQDEALEVGVRIDG